MDRMDEEEGEQSFDVSSDHGDQFVMINSSLKVRCINLHETLSSSSTTSLSFSFSLNQRSLTVPNDVHCVAQVCADQESQTEDCEVTVIKLRDFSRLIINVST